MFTLLIVDDEPSVRTGLRDCIEWSQYGIEVVGEANDGELALQLAEQLRPDLVITDVRMPIMDGIQFAYEVSSRLPATRILFISGYDDVEYLKSALKINAFDYMLKPVNLDELHQVLLGITGTLQSKLRQDQRIKAMQEKLLESMPVLREKYVVSLLREAPATGERTREKLEFLELNWPLEANYWVMVIDIDDKPEQFFPLLERDRQLLAYAILNICQELIDRHIQGYVIEYGNGEFVSILWDTQLIDEAELLFRVAEEVRENIQRWLKFNVTIGIGERVDGPRELHRSYRMARAALNQRWYLGKNRVIAMNKIQTPSPHAPQFDAAVAEKLEALICAGDREGLNRVVADVFRELGNQRTLRFKFGLNAAFQMLLLGSRVSLELGLWNEQMEREEAELWEVLPRLDTLHDVREQLTAYLNGIVRVIIEKQEGKNGYYIELVKKHIEQHYADNLSVAHIAKEVFLNPTYMCMLFKQETGGTIHEYLYCTRMEQAKRLLADPGNRFYEIAAAVGYSDPSYFSKQFKKYTGLSPSAYRDRFL